MTVKNPEIAAASGNLYVYLKDKNALLEIGGIKDFKSYVKKGGVKK